MKKTIVALSFIFALAAPAAAGQINFVEQFMNRYRPSKVELPMSAAERAQTLTNLIQSGGLPLTVGDLINLMLNNNLDVNVNRLNPRVSEFLVEALYRPFEPTLNLQASVNRNTTPATSQFIGVPALHSLTHSYLIGFGQTIATGTNVGVDFTMNRSSSNSPFNTFSPSWIGNIRYSFNQHLLRDYGREINTRQILVGRNNKKISEVQFERQLIDMVAQAQRMYWDLVFTAEDLKVKQRSMELAQKTLSENKIQVDVGTMAPLDLVQAESEVATRREQLILSSYSQTQIEDQIKKMITPQGDPGLILAKLTPSDSARRPNPAEVTNIAEAIKIALENRPELKVLDYELQNKNIELKYTRNQLLPLVDVFATYTQNGVGGRLTERAGFGPDAPVIRVVPGGLGDAMGQVFGYDFTGYSIGFSMQIPLTNRAAQGDHARATTEKRLTEDRIGAAAQQIALEVRNALTIVEMNKARIEAAETARTLAERRLEAENKKFELGASTVRFVLEEQRNVTQAQTNEIAALVNYTKALVDLDRAMGMTLRKNNIAIEKSLTGN